MKKYLLAFTIFMLAAATVCSAQEVSGKQTIPARKFKRWSQEPNTVILDVRTSEEYAEGHIPGSVLIDVKKEDFASHLGNLDKSKRYLIYCRSGKRSAKALGIMQEKGFSDVYHLKGGIQKWKGEKIK